MILTCHGDCWWWKLKRPAFLGGDEIRQVERHLLPQAARFFFMCSWRGSNQRSKSFFWAVFSEVSASTLLIFFKKSSSIHVENRAQVTPRWNLKMWLSKCILGNHSPQKLVLLDGLSSQFQIQLCEDFTGATNCFFLRAREKPWIAGIHCANSLVWTP